MAVQPLHVAKKALGILFKIAAFFPGFISIAFLIMMFFSNDNPAPYIIISLLFGLLSFGLFKIGRILSPKKEPPKNSDTDTLEELQRKVAIAEAETQLQEQFIQQQIHEAERVKKLKDLEDYEIAERQHQQILQQQLFEAERQRIVEAAEQQEILEREKQRLQYEADMLEINKQQDYIAAKREHQYLLNQQIFEIERQRIVEATEQKEKIQREIQLLKHEEDMLNLTERRKTIKKRLDDEKHRQMSIEAEIESVDRMEGHEFEHYCAELLLRIGFDDAVVTKGSGDQGVDVLAEKDGIRYAIQCKNYTSKLSNTPVQEVSAGKLFYNCHIAVVMTNSTLSPGAEELAKATNVLVWDRPKLHRMIEEAHNN